MAENENINQTPVVDADVGTAADVEAIMKKYDRPTPAIGKVFPKRCFVGLRLCSASI